MCSKNITGSYPVKAVFSKPYTSTGVEGTATLIPGMCMKSVSMLCEWCAAADLPRPSGPRRTIGRVPCPPDMYRIFMI